MQVAGRFALSLRGALAGAALGSLPGAAGLGAVAAGAVLGAIAGALLRQSDGPSPFAPPPLAPPGRHLLERAAPLLLLVFLAPLSTMAVPPGADMAMHTALARGLVEGRLSPAWGALHLAAYPRGFSALVALLAPLGFARAALLISALSYAVFWAGLAAVLEGPLATPWPRTAALVALLLSRTPQSFFAWGGNPTALALGLSLLGAAALDRARPRDGGLAALLLAGAAAVHPMGACAGALVAAVVALRRRAWLAGALAAAGLLGVLGALALFGPQVSAHELDWIRDCARNAEHVGTGILGDPANVVTLLAAALLIWKRRYPPVALAGGLVAALAILFAVLPLAGLYPGRFAPLLLLAVAPLWAQAADPFRRRGWLAAAALCAAVPGHLHWYQRSTPIATFADLANIACAARTVPPGAVIDGAYGDATQWIPALTGLAVTRPHQHCTLFDETDQALSALPKASFRFVGQQLRYPPPIGAPPATQPLCAGALYPSR